MKVLPIPTGTHGRIFVEDPADSFSGGVLIGCHGYGQSGGMMLEELARIPDAHAWRLVSVQALHRFYTRNDQSVVASWMTREDREFAIADNIEYMNRVLSETAADAQAIVFLGFSQGASMAARAAVRCARPAAGLVMIGGDIPSDVREDASLQWPRVLIGVGSEDQWYGTRVESDLKFLASRGVTHEVVRYQGGHEFTDELRAAVGQWLGRWTGDDG
jgi:predicted esterase